MGVPSLLPAGHRRTETPTPPRRLPRLPQAEASQSVGLMLRKIRFLMTANTCGTKDSWREQPHRTSNLMRSGYGLRGDQLAISPKPTSGPCREDSFQLGNFRLARYSPATLFTPGADGSADSERTNLQSVVCFVVALLIQLCTPVQDHGDWCHCCLQLRVDEDFWPSLLTS